MSKTITKLNADLRVSSAWYEGEDGYWVTARAGWSFDFYGDNAHTIHEWNVRDILRQFRTIRPCHCAECKGELAKLRAGRPAL